MRTFNKMKVDRSKSKRSSSEVPADCKALIDKLKSCNHDQLLHELKQIKSWTCGKCELYHWVDILDTFDEILAKCCEKQHSSQWNLPCDSLAVDAKSKELLTHILSFTALLIEHSFSRHLYNSMEHLITLLSSSDMQIVLSVLSLLFVFSKRSNFIGKLNLDMRQELLTRLSYLAEVSFSQRIKIVLSNKGILQNNNKTNQLYISIDTFELCRVGVVKKMDLA